MEATWAWYPTTKTQVLALCRSHMDPVLSPFDLELLGPHTLCIDDYVHVLYFDDGMLVTMHAQVA